MNRPRVTWLFSVPPRQSRCRTTITSCVLIAMLVVELGYWLPFWPFASVPEAAAADQAAILVESFDQDVTTDGSTFILTNDVGDTDSAFIRMNTGTRKSSAGPTGSTGDTAPNVGTVGLVLSDTNEVTVERVNGTAVKVMGEVWRYEGPLGGEHEFIVRDRVAVTLSGSAASNPISGIVDEDDVVPFITGYTVDNTSSGAWNEATIAAHIDDGGNLVVSRNNSGTTATVYVDVVEFTGSAWSVCHGYSNDHDTALETVTLNTDSDGQGGATCGVGDWGTASIIEATMEGDTTEAGLSQTLALVRPGSSTTTVEFDVHQQQANARNDGEAWIHVIQNDDMIVNRASNSAVSEGNGTYGSEAWPFGAALDAPLDTLSLEWFSDTSGLGTAHMRGGLHARITEPSPLTYSDGDLIPSVDYDSTVTGSYELDITFTASPSGVVLEVGGTGTGSFVGYNDSGDFIVRAGNGGSTAPSDAARLVITSSDYDFSSRTGTLSFNFIQSTNSVELFFDEGSNGSIDYSTSTTAASAWANWSGGDDGFVGNGSGSIAGSEITSGLNFNGTITEARFTQGAGAGIIEHWIHRDRNNVAAEYGVIELAGLTFDPIFFGFDTLVTATSSHVANLDIPSNDEYVGGAFVIRERSATRNVTDITITETGTIDGSTGLTDIELWYDVSTSTPYDCREHSFDGNETQFGSTDANGFSGADGSSSFSDTVQISTTRSFCVYPVMSVTDDANDGDTIAISIDDPANDVVVTGGGDVGNPVTPQSISGSTTVTSADVTQIHYHWREDDGSEAGASSVDGAEDVPAGGFQVGTQRRLRIAVSAEGSSDANAAQFRLQYAEKAGTCEAASGWEDIATEGGAWDIGDSPNVAFGEDTTNIASAGLGAVSDEELNFVGTSTIVDGGDKSLSVTLANDEFTELEYTLLTTSAAVEGTTYCFRLVDETPDVTHAYRIPITVQASEVDSTLTDFPIYVDLNNLGPHFFSNVRSDGGDIRVTAADGTTELPREVVSISTGSNAGELHFEAPTVSASANTTFYIYYGASDEVEHQASSTYGTQQVWSANYVGVYHLDETGSSYSDSTGINADGVGEVNDPSATAGQLGGAEDFVANGRIDLGNSMNASLISAGEYYVSSWVNLDTSAADQSPVSQYEGPGDFLLWADTGGTGTGFCHYNGSYMPSDCQDLNNQSVGSWQYLAAYHDGTNGGIYLDGAETGLGPTATTFGIDPALRFAIGATDGDDIDRYFNGQIDEVRISNASLGLDWSAAEFSNQSTPTTFYATSTFESMSADAVPITYDVYPEANLTADITVSASSSQTTALDAGAVNQYLGGTFVIERDGGNRTFTDITVSETGTVDASTNLSNVKLFYDLDTTAPYNCTGESYTAGVDAQFGVTDSNGFSAANGSSTFSDSVTVSDTQAFCGYVVLDIAARTTNGETIAVEIANPANDVVVTVSTVGPSTAISPTGSTTINGPVLVQTGYHWRNDNDSEADASSATGGTENSPLLDVPRAIPYRLRLQVDNTGTVSTQADQYQLQYATKVVTCELASTWQAVDVGSAFTMASTSQLVNGNDTIDVAPGSGGISNPAGQTFLSPNGAQKEDDDTTAALTLTSSQFAEFEYAIEVTELAGFDTTYCFRVVADSEPLSGYTTYAELTTREKQDFFVQRGTQFVTGTGTTLIAGVDYTAPADPARTFVRITNTNFTGAGASSEGTQEPKDVTAYISDQSGLTSSFTISRPTGALGDTRVSWELVEYTGLVGADNEIIVRDTGTVTYGSGLLTASGGTVSGVADDEAVVVFITGQLNPSTSNSDYMSGQSTAAWATTTQQPEFTRGQTRSTAAAVSYAVVEFAGLNWKVQRVEHVYTIDTAPEIKSIKPVNSLFRSFIHAQKRIAGTADGLDDFGHIVGQNSIGSVSFELNSGADVPSDHTSVAWVIENTQTSTGAMQVFRTETSVDNDETIEPRITVLSFPGSTNNLSNTSVHGTNDSTGTGTAYPRTMLGLTATSTSEFEVYESDAGQTQAMSIMGVQWPVAQLAFQQNYYQLYVDNDTLTPTDPWPVGAADLGENMSLTGSDDPIGEDERIRIRMSLETNNATWPESTVSFKLQYGRRDTPSCSSIVSWNDVGAVDSGTVWRGFDTTPADGTELPSTILSVSDVAATYEESNNSAPNPNFADIGDNIEFDWLIEHNGAAQRTDYCFRMVEADGTELSSYNNYPVVRTTGYTPVINDWRWYDDETQETPVSPFAAENTTATNIAGGEMLSLRVNLAEVENADGQNLKFFVQYSEYSDFRDGGTTLTATSSCEADSLWCYADGGADDNDTITTAVLSSSASCTGGVGDGCGSHNEVATSTGSVTHPALTNSEFSFTLQQAGARVNAVYYFRLVNADTEEVVSASSSYPSLLVEGSSASFAGSTAVAPGVTTDGFTSDATTTPSTVDFGTVPFDTEFIAIQRFTIDVNSTEGYRVLALKDQPLTNTYGDTIAPVTAANGSPEPWSTACATPETGCFGYHTSDDVLSDIGTGAIRFAADDSFAGFSTDPDEVFYSSVPGTDVHDIIYRLQVGDQQPAGDYNATITYIIVPIF